MEAWDLFEQDEECRNAFLFLSLRQQDQSGSDINDQFTLNPVMVGGHAWCNIHCVEYFVWVKENVDKLIYIDVDEKTYGVCKWLLNQVVLPFS